VQRPRGFNDDGPEAPVALLETVMPADDCREFLRRLAVVASAGGEPPLDRGDVSDQGHHPVEQVPHTGLTERAPAQENGPTAPRGGTAQHTDPPRVQHPIVRPVPGMDVELRIIARDDFGQPGPPADPVCVPVFVNPACEAATHAELTEHRRLACPGYAGNEAEAHQPPLSAAGVHDSPGLPAGARNGARPSQPKGVCCG